MQPLNNHYIPIHRSTPIRWPYSDMDSYDVRPVPVNFGHLHYSPLHESPFAQVSVHDEGVLVRGFKALREFLHPLTHMLPWVKGPHSEYCTDQQNQGFPEIRYIAVA